MKHFKLVYGYAANEYVSIDENDLVKAQVMFMEQKGRALFGDTAIRGQDIIRITPDWHAHFGWNKGYKMTPEDDEYIAPLEKPYKMMLTGVKEIARFIVENKRYDLLEAPLNEQKLALPKKELPKEISEGAKMLSDKFKV